jgi:hypothetical protein
MKIGHSVSEILCGNECPERCQSCGNYNLTGRYVFVTFHENLRSDTGIFSPFNKAKRLDTDKLLQTTDDAVLVHG